MFNKNKKQTTQKKNTSYNSFEFDKLIASKTTVRQSRHMPVSAVTTIATSDYRH